MNENQQKDQFLTIQKRFPWLENGAKYIWTHIRGRLFSWENFTVFTAPYAELIQCSKSETQEQILAKWRWDAQWWSPSGILRTTLPVPAPALPAACAGICTAQSFQQLTEFPWGSPVREGKWWFLASYSLVLKLKVMPLGRVKASLQPWRLGFLLCPRVAFPC